MTQYIEENRRIPVMPETDVIVAGGGIAGVAAALAAVRSGMRVTLMEKQVQLGGLATTGLVNWYEPMDDGEGRQLVTGISDELMHLAIRDGYDNLSQDWKQGHTGDPAGPRCCTKFNPAVLSLAMNELLVREGVQLLYDMAVCLPHMQGVRCDGVITESKSGRAFYPCRMLIDATGDADMLHRAGVPCRQGQNYFTYYGHGVSSASLKAVLETGNYAKLNANGFFVGSDLEGHGHPEGMKRFGGVTAEEVSEYVTLGQQGLLEKLRANRDLNLTALPAMVQFRTTRSLDGVSTFDDADGCRAERSIGATGDFRYRSRRYELDAGILYHNDYPNLLAAGRTVSATTGGWEVTRVIPTAALTGQAAGTLAALAIRLDCPVNRVPVDTLQHALSAAGVTLHF
ncbi:MAG: FAD-dependent oxidoreductase [Aristaeellaceae bacterium]